MHHREEAFVNHFPRQGPTCTLADTEPSVSRVSGADAGMRNESIGQRAGTPSLNQMVDSTVPYILQYPPLTVHVTTSNTTTPSGDQMNVLNSGNGHTYGQEASAVPVGHSAGSEMQTGAGACVRLSVFIAPPNAQRVRHPLRP